MLTASRHKACFALSPLKEIQSGPTAEAEQEEWNHREGRKDSWRLFEALLLLTDCMPVSLTFAIKVDNRQYSFSIEMFE